MLSARTIVLWAVGLGLVAVTSVVVLLVTLGSGEPRDGVRLDVVRTASSIVLGTGGAAALLLTARRQRYAELDLVQKDHDATERRVTSVRQGRRPAGQRQGAGHRPGCTCLNGWLRAPPRTCRRS